MSKHPINPARASRPGGWNTPTDIHYMEAIQNRNKTRLLEILGQAPPLMEDIIPEDAESHRVRNMILKSIKTTGKYMGVYEFAGGMQESIQSVRSRFLSQALFDVGAYTMPMQKLFNEVQFQYESYISQYPAGATVGSMFGWGVGYAIGSIYLGPLGGAVLGAAGQVIGGLGGAALEQFGQFSQDWIADILGMEQGEPTPSNPLGFVPAGQGTKDQTGLGGMPYQRTRMNVAPTRSRTAGLIIKMQDLERRLY